MISGPLNAPTLPSPDIGAHIYIYILWSGKSLTLFLLSFDSSLFQDLVCPSSRKGGVLSRCNRFAEERHFDIHPSLRFFLLFILRSLSLSLSPGNHVIPSVIYCLGCCSPVFFSRIPRTLTHGYKESKGGGGNLFSLSLSNAIFESSNSSRRR